MLTCCTKTLLHPNHFLDRTSLPVYNGNESSKPLKTQASTDIVPPASTDIIPQASTDIVLQAGIEIVLKQAQISFSSRHRYCSQASTDIVLKQAQISFNHDTAKHCKCSGATT